MLAAIIILKNYNSRKISRVEGREQGEGEEGKQGVLGTELEQITLHAFIIMLK